MARSSGPRGRPGAGSEGARTGLWREEGQTLLEYALIIGFIGMGTITFMWALGPVIGEAFQVVTNVLTDVGFPA